MKIYQTLAQLVGAYSRCIADGSDKHEWADRHEARILAMVKEHFPSGSGFDSGTTIDMIRSTEEKLFFSTSFHHMNDVGFYDGWTEHEIIVTPSLAFGFHVRVTGRDRRQIKDYIGEVFHEVLSRETPTEEKEASNGY